MGEKKQVEVMLLRYVPDAVKGEGVNIGLLMVEPGAETGFAEVRFTQDWRKVQCIDPDADLEILQALERNLRLRIRDVSDRAALMKMMKESFSGTVELASMSGCMTENPAEEIETLARMYFEGPHVGRPAVRSGRQLILQQMRRAFEQAGVADFLMRDISADAYTRPGSRLKIDFGYRLGAQEMKLFHAVSLKTNPDSASSLADRYPLLAEGILEKEGRLASLTAVIEEELNHSAPEIDFAVATLTAKNIRVRSVAEMPAIAEQARVELGV